MIDIPSVSPECIEQQLKNTMQQMANVHPDDKERHNVLKMSLARYNNVRPFQIKPSYSISDFTDYHDEVFIRNAYLGILNREPDADGFNHYLTQLRSGRLSKNEILGYLRYSPEGRAKNIKIHYLLVCFAKQLVCRIPILGYVFQWLWILVKLPLLVDNFRRFESYTHAHFTYTHQFIDQQSDILEEYLAQLYSYYESLRAQYENLHIQHQVLSEKYVLSQAQLSDLQEYHHALYTKYQELHEKMLSSQIQYQELHDCYHLLSQKYDTLQKQSNDSLQTNQKKFERLLKRIEQIEQGKADRGQVGELNQRMKDLRLYLAGLVNNDALQAQLTGVRSELQQQLRDQKRLIMDHQHRLFTIMEMMQDLRLSPYPPLQADETPPTTIPSRLDAIYLSIEDRFRGSRVDIQQLQHVYLPYLQQAGLGAESAPILDIGCGRGEWLTLLKQNGYLATGIDNNRFMIRECQLLDLEVIEADAISYLREQPDQSLGCITGFHIIEHIPFIKLVELFEEAWRALKPNGLLIVETPNPENIIVGAYTFYFDPTHQKPLPPELTQYLAEICGFTKTKIVRLHPRTEVGQEDALKAKWFCSAVDYALISYK